MGEAGVQDAQGLVEARLLAVQHVLLAPQHHVHLAQQPHLPVTQRLQVPADRRVDLRLDLSARENTFINELIANHNDYLRTD